MLKMHANSNSKSNEIIMEKWDTSNKMLNN